MKELIRYDAACRAIAAATKVDEVKTIRDAAVALKAYAKQAENKDLEADAWEIRTRAERRIGELVADQKAAVGLSKGGRPTKTGFRLNPVSLAEVLGKNHKTLADRGRKYAAVPIREFERVITEGRERVINHVRQESTRVTQNLLRLGDRASKRAERHAPPLPSGVFRLLYVDPPWQYEHIVTESRAIENQYPTMPLDAIKALAVPAAADAVLFLWATSPKLAEAVDVIRAWRFDYRTCAVWDKEVIGMGYYFRQQHELLLVAARGALPVPEPSARSSSVIRARRGRHSEKPDRVYELLETMYPAFTEDDRVELFSRRARPGWSAWSNEPALAV